MTFQGDPYRTLGLVPGASVNEIRSAYRRLAKRYHPDAAGERAVPRFLAIQAAYEALVDANGDLRRGAMGSGGGPGPRPEAWRADPSRARASRDAWRARGRSDDGGADPGGTERPPGEQAGRAGQAAGKGDRQAPGAGAEHHRRHRRAATPGSTTYDEADETPLDPAWDGGTWYGASSGTYWTLNPREYADPRKHGPEYRRRAWRVAGHRTPASGSPSASASVPEASQAPPDPWADPPAADTPAEAEHAGMTALAALGELLPERLLARVRHGLAGRALVTVVATLPFPVVIAIVLAGLAGCDIGDCPPALTALVFASWGVVGLVVAAVPPAAAVGMFAALVAGAGTLLSGILLAVAFRDLTAALEQGAGSLGVVLYCFALVVGGARLYVRREPDAPAS